jgi:hypothetical protein
MTKEAQSDFLIQNAINKMTEFLIEDYKLPVTEAMNIVYNSETLNILQNKETELFIQSPAYIYELLKEEYLNGKIA